MLIRYLTMEKFEWFLSDLGIYLGSASCQSDKNEGVFDSEFFTKYLKVNIDKIDQDLCDNVDELQESLMHLNREHCYLSCWHINDVETETMWDQYGCNGVALISDERLLISELPEPIGNASEFYKVEYCDKKKSQAINKPLKYKENKYAHEKEFRIIVDMKKYFMLTGFDESKFGPAGYIGDKLSYESDSITCCLSQKGKEQSHLVLTKKKDGYVISYDLNKIITEIRLHPSASLRDKEKVKGMLNQAELDIAIQQSKLEVES